MPRAVLVMLVLPTPSVLAGNGPTLPAAAPGVSAGAVPDNLLAVCASMRGVNLTDVVHNGVQLQLGFRPARWGPSLKLPWSARWLVKVASPPDVEASVSRLTAHVLSPYARIPTCAQFVLLQAALALSALSASPQRRPAIPCTWLRLRCSMPRGPGSVPLT
jgi:hypothetical protein